MGEIPSCGIEEFVPVTAALTVQKELPKLKDFDPNHRLRFLAVESFGKDTVIDSFTMAAPNNSQNNRIPLDDQIDPTAVSLASNMQPSPQASPAGNAPQDPAQLPQQAQAQMMQLDPKLYSTEYVVDPWQSTPPSSGNESKTRAVWHLHRLNLMHEARKKNSDKYSLVYQQQSNLLSSAAVSCIAIILGFRNINLLLEIYNKDPTKNSAVLPKILAGVRDNVTPGLRTWGPTRLRDVINRFMDSINDPQTRAGWYNNTVADLYQMFCGIKGALLMIDRYREKNAEACADDEMAGLTFKSQFTVTRQQFWLWLAPNRDDEEMGDYDHWFGN